MSYLDNLIAWGDNLFSIGIARSPQRSHAALCYRIRDPGTDTHGCYSSSHADDSFAQLEPSLDAFANAMVDIENSIGAIGRWFGFWQRWTAFPAPQTFYFKIPSNPQLLGYWDDGRRSTLQIAPLPEHRRRSAAACARSMRPSIPAC